MKDGVGSRGPIEIRNAGGRKGRDREASGQIDPDMTSFVNRRITFQPCWNFDYDPI